MGGVRGDAHFDLYSSPQMREEQKALLNGLLGIIYDNYDTTRRMQHTVDGIYRIAVTILIFVLLAFTLMVIVVGYFMCKRYQSERNTSPSPHARKAAPIEI